MFEVAVTTTPLDLGAAIGLPPTGMAVSHYRLQNRGPEAFYRTVSVASPDPAAVRGYRHQTSSVIDIRIQTADIEGATWVWTSQGTATAIVEQSIR